MSTSARIQLFLGFMAAGAAYLLLVVYNGGRIDFGHAGLLELFRGRPAAAAHPAPAASAQPQ
jgi:hypothetical protein